MEFSGVASAAIDERILEEAAKLQLLTQLTDIQSRLLDAGSAIATPISSSNPARLARVQFDAQATERLEQAIDAMEEVLPPLRNFILPVCGTVTLVP